MVFVLYSADSIVRRRRTIKRRGIGDLLSWLTTKTTTINTLLITMTDNDNDDDSDKPVVSVICDVRTVAIIDSGNDNSDKQTCCVICDARR